MTLCIDFLRQCAAWTDDDDLHAVIADELDALVKIDWNDERSLHEGRLLVRSIVYNTVAVTMLPLKQTPELDRLRSVSVGDDPLNPRPVTQALLVGLRRMRGKNPRASYLLFCALKAVDLAYRDSPHAAHWAAKTQLAATSMFPSTFGSVGVVYSTVIHDVLKNLPARITVEADPFASEPDPFG